jgi:WhiB family redox-sensing transcriptional regulator
MTIKFTTIEGNELRLRDTAVKEYIVGVEELKVAHSEIGFGEKALSEHAHELRAVTASLVYSYTTEKSKNPHSGIFWRKVIEFAVTDLAASHDLMQAYGYSRLNSLLNAEFGPDENQTTNIIRTIGNQVLTKEIARDDPSRVYSFFNARLPITVLSAIYPAQDRSYLNPKLQARLFSLSDTELETPDRAITRILSTMLFLHSNILSKLPEETRNRILLVNQSVFGDLGRSEKPNPTNESSEDEDEANEAPSKVKVDDALKPDFRLANCKIIRLEDETYKEYANRVNERRILMFSTIKLEQDEAKGVCLPCEIKDECLEYAIAEGLDEGIWGGESGRKRITIRKERKKLKNLVGEEGIEPSIR